MTRAERPYSTPAAAEIHGVTTGRLIKWIEKGLVVPDFGDAAGPRAKRQLSFKNLMELGLVKALSDKHMHTHTIKKLMDVVREYDAFSHPYSISAFARGMGGLAGGGLPRKVRMVKEDGSEVEETREPGPPHVGSVWWIEGQTPIAEQNAEGKLEVVGYQTTLIPYILSRTPIGEINLQFVTRLHKTVDMILAVDLGEIERHVYEATAE